jgi:hypothetical protein
MFYVWGWKHKVVTSGRQASVNNLACFPSLVYTERINIFYLFEGFLWPGPGWLFLPFPFKTRLPL